MSRRASAWITLLLASAALHGEVPSLAMDEVRVGAKGYGLTVMQGTEPRQFEAEVIGHLRQVQPGRDMVLVRCSGLGLEKTGVVAGMSGSPVYIGDRLLGAIAYTWEFGLEPIAGVTPYRQMVALASPVQAAGGPPHRMPTLGGGLVPVRTPILVTPMSPALRELLTRELAPWNMVPVQGGAVGKGEPAGEPLVPGSSVAVGMVTGDIQVTALGTVTAIDAGRVYALGHPFLQLGRCELPLMSAYVHTVLPMQSASIKLGSPMQVVGRVDADVSTGIAGTIGDAPRMIPVSVRVQGPTAAEPRTLHCQVAWVPSLFSSLFVSTLAGGLEAEGQAPAELTVHLRATIQFEAEPAIEIDRVFSGESMSGGAGLTSALSNVSNIVARGAHSTLGSVFVESVDAQIRVEARRTSVAIVRAWAEPAELVAGESTAILVEFRPHRAPEQTTVRRYTVQVPAGFAPGEYRVDVHSAVTDFALEQRRRQTLAEPATWKDLLAGLREEAAARTTDLILRLETKEQGVSTSRRDWVDLPPGIASILASDPAASARSMPEVVRQREETPWPLEGSKSLTLRVVRQAARRFGPVPVPEVAR